MFDYATMNTKRNVNILRESYKTQVRESGANEWLLVS